MPHICSCGYCAVEPYDDRCKFEIQLDELTLWGSGEICAELDVTRTTLRRWRDGGTFPEPGWTINGGRTEVWEAAAVRAWDAGRRAAQR